MRLHEIMDKEDKTIAVKIHARKKKKNNPLNNQTDPSNPDINTEYGMSGRDRVDGVIQP